MSVATAVEDLVKIFLDKNIEVGGTTVQVASLLKSVGALGVVDWPSVIKAIEAGQWQSGIAPIEDVLRIVGLFVPPVAIAESDFEAVLPILEFLIAHSVPPRTVDPSLQAVFPSANSPDDKTQKWDGGDWPTANQP